MIQGVKVADRLAVAALVLAAVAAAAGLLVAGLYRDTAEMVREARAADLVTLAVAVPLVGWGLWRARSESASARLIAIGALGYLSYSYAIFAFSVVINPMTPVHIAILGLATWPFVLAIFALDQATFERASRIRMSRRPGWCLPHRRRCPLCHAVAWPDRGRDHERRAAGIRP